MSLPAEPLNPLALLPGDRPFTRQGALQRSVTDAALAELVHNGILNHPVRGVYYDASLEDDLSLRVACLELVIPDDAVVTDRTAAWLLGAPMVLAPGDHLSVPRVSLFRPPGYRVRNGLSVSGERTLLPGDVMQVGNIKVTTPLRTALDVGRLLRRDQALAVMDALRSVHDFGNDDLIRGSARFKGERGVVQLRALAPHVDGKSGSAAESACRSVWLLIDGVPKPELQIEVAGPTGPYFLDLGVKALKYALEYDGEEFHGPERAEHDRNRRAWIRSVHGWTIDVVTRAEVFGAQAHLEAIIIAGLADAERR